MALRRSTPEQVRAWRQRSKKLKRKPMKRAAPKARSTQAEADAKHEFWEAARKQRVCAGCGRSDHWDAHHVVEKQWLRVNGFDEYDPDNALRVCDELSLNDCHGKHTRGDRLRLTDLEPQNLEFAFRVMGRAAGYYLRARYRGEDPRLDELEQAHE